MAARVSASVMLGLSLFAAWRATRQTLRRVSVGPRREASLATAAGGSPAATLGASMLGRSSQPTCTCSSGEESEPSPSHNGFQKLLEVATAWVAIVVLAYVGLAEVFKAAMTLRRTRNLESTIWQLLNYRLENWWARNPTAIPLSLAYVTLVTNMIGGVVFSAATGESLGNAIFKTWTFLCDPAAHTELDTVVATTLGVALTMLGLIICGFLISIITDLVTERVAAVKKGNSRVIESGHTLILGYSEGNLRPLISQIAVANASEGGGVVVVLATRPNEFLQKEVSYLKHELRGTSVVVRSGSPLRTTDLDIVSPQTARAIVVLADNEVSAEESDAVVMRTVLALSSFESLNGHVVAELRDVDNEDHISLISRHPIECVVVHDVVGHLMIQCARQRDLALVLDSLLGYDNDEIYFDHWPSLVGRTFAEVTRSFDLAIPIGLKRSVDGSVVINPPEPEKTVVEPGDEIIVVAEDNDTYSLLEDGPVAMVDVPADEPPAEGSRGPPRVSACGELPPNARLYGSRKYRRRLGAVPNVDADQQRPQHFLFLGWRRDVMDMISFLDEILSVGSSLTIMSTMPVNKRLVEMAENGRKLDLNTIALHHVVGNHVSRRQLAQLPLLWYDAILILSEKSHETKVLATDSLTCASLVLVRDIQAHKECPAAPPAPATSPRGVCATTTTLVDEPAQLQLAPPSAPQQRARSWSPTPFDLRRSPSGLAESQAALEHISSDERLRRGPGRPRRESALLYRLLDSQAISSDEEDDDLVHNAPPRPDSDSRSGHQRGRWRSFTGSGNLAAAEKKQQSERAHREVKTQIICELLDSTRWDQLQRFCDVVASNDFTSRILAMASPLRPSFVVPDALFELQVSERAETNQVLQQLLSPPALLPLSRDCLTPPQVAARFGNPRASPARLRRARRAPELLRTRRTRTPLRRHLHRL